jgi:hypothetical protein
MKTNGLTFAHFENTPQALGLLCDFVSVAPPFNRLEFRQMVATLQYQLANKNHIVVGRNNEIVGYLGWISTTIEIAEKWVANEGPLTGVPGASEAAVPTVFVVVDGSISLPLIRHAKTLQGQNSIYWKREFISGRAAAKRSVRKKPV